MTSVILRYSSPQAIIVKTLSINDVSVSKNKNLLSGGSKDHITYTVKVHKMSKLIQRIELLELKLPPKIR